MKEYSVASSHYLSTKAGLDVLAAGGNAYDAVIATSAALTVVQPHLNGLGGDFFAVVDEKKVYAVNGNGYAAGLATIDFFESKGLEKIPAHGHLSSFSVPGLVSSWSLLLKNSSIPLPKLLEPAIRLARDGFLVTPSIHKSIEKTRQFGDEDWTGIYGKVGEGGVLRQKQLSETLEKVASDGGHSFYHGEIAKRIDGDMSSKGGLIRFDDLDGYQAKIVSPLKTKYRGHDVYTNPPSSQGATELIWFNMLGRHTLRSMGRDEYYSILLSTMKTAYDYRSKHIADPAWLPFNEELLRPDYDYASSSPPRRAEPSISDTTGFSVFDGEIGISAIQSNYMGFGSGHTIGGTGINMNNRGSYFTLDGSHHNALAPRKKTFHTLMATLAKGPTSVYFSSMGGDVQPQINVQVICNILDRGMGMQAAVSEPRFAYPASIYADSEIYYEKNLELKTGRAVDNLNSMMGHAHGILVSDSVEAGIDPRGDGLIKYD